MKFDRELYKKDRKKFITRTVGYGMLFSIIILVMLQIMFHFFFNWSILVRIIFSLVYLIVSFLIFTHFAQDFAEPHEAKVEQILRTYEL